MMEFLKYYSRIMVFWAMMAMLLDALRGEMVAQSITMILLWAPIMYYMIKVDNKGV